MQALKIHTIPDPILRAECLSVDEITSNEINLFKNMVYTMNINEGIGLAGPQIGIAKRIIVLKDEKGKIIKLINPRIVSSSGSGVMTEGCLSIPHRSVEIVRPYEVTVIGRNEKDKEVQIEAKGLMARVLQHEIDHLSGKLIIDYGR